MNKTKKVAIAAVSIVMAGTMAVSFTACKKKPPVDSTIKIIEYASGTTVRTSLGYNSDTTAISFSNNTLPLVNADGSEANTSVKLPDGTTYMKGSLKPIWQSYEDVLDIQVSDNWTQADDNLTQCATEGLQNYDLIGAGNVNSITTQINAGSLLNLRDYLDNMPNLRHFLETNALAELGTLADAETGAIYYTPYYAGMNDAERFNLFRKDYVSELLDHASDYSKNGGTITFKAQTEAKKANNLGNRKANEVYDGSKSSITAYMGTTGSYTVETSDPADSLKTIFVKVDYDAAAAAAKNGNTELGKAISAAAGKAYTGTSGNIVDLQNFAINETGGSVTGEGLLKILRAYIDVAYKWAATANATSWNQFYNSTVNGVATKRGDIINSTFAAWDVDIYAAIGRCFVTCGNLLGSHQAQTSADTNYGASTWLLVPRTGYTNRTTRVTAMIGELYGVRGMEGMTYIDSTGNLRQTRFNASTWDALTRFSAFHTEGLVPSFNTGDVSSEIGSVGGSSANSLYDGTGSHFQGLSSNDFVHTQTTGYTSDYAQKSTGYVQTTDGYDWTCVVTPVSRWLTTDESTYSANTGALTTNDVLLKDRPADKCTVMRFTESALKLKTGGLVVPKSTASDTNRLGATLALIDYIYSNDGLILTTFGDRSDTDNITGNDTDGYTTTNNGWWYGEEVKTLTIDGKETDISGMSMNDLYNRGVVTTYDNSKQFTITEEYQSQALVYKNKLYRTGTVNGEYDEGYIYNGVMTPYFTQAVRKLCLDRVAVNGYKSTTVMSSTNLQNLLLGMESHGIVNNAGMVQLCNDMSVAGFNIFSAAMGNGSLKTVTQSIGENPWYTCAPTITLTGEALNTSNSYADFTTLFRTSSSIVNYLILEVGWYGANANFTDFGTVSQTGDISSPEKIATYLRNIAPQYENLNNAVWAELYVYYTNK